MRINRLETHDRLLHFKKNDQDIGACCQNLIDARPFGSHPFYIFAHARTEDDGVTKRMIWQPRLTKPKAQTNSMLFKAFPGTEYVRVIWIIPARELWEQFEKGKVTASKTIIESIDKFLNHREQLESKDEDDLSDEQISAIYTNIARGAKLTKQMKKKSNLMLENGGASSTSSES
jgi:hypothetical protein